MCGVWLVAVGVIVVVMVVGCFSGLYKLAVFVGGVSASIVVIWWWFNSVVKMGSIIDWLHLDVVVGKLHLFDKDYCGMFLDMLKLGKSILFGVWVSDFVLLQVMIVFIVEI